MNLPTCSVVWYTFYIRIWFQICSARIPLIYSLSYCLDGKTIGVKRVLRQHGIMTPTNQFHPADKSPQFSQDIVESTLLTFRMIFSFSSSYFKSGCFLAAVAHLLLPSLSYCVEVLSALPRRSSPKRGSRSSLRVVPNAFCWLLVGSCHVRGVMDERSQLALRGP